MSRPCTICGRPDRAAIDEALRRGDSTRAIARAHPGALKDSVSRHHGAGHHLATASAPPAAAVAPAPPAPSSAKPPRARAAPRAAVQVAPPSSSSPAPAAEAPTSTAPGSPGYMGPEHGAAAPAAPRDREGRVRHCMGLMASNQWETGVTGPELAAEWGLHPGTLDHYAAEASRRVKAVGESDYVRTRIAAALDEALGHGLEMLRPRVTVEDNVQVTERGDPRALGGLASLVKAFGELAGVKPKAEPIERHDEPPTFRVELASPERPPAETDPCPSSGTSSPPGDEPGAG
jgi:hypothetical protein